ncbi:hypothetical protein PMAYCL1PPCAC_03778, partial [Pristionchus mayeri]
GRRSPNSPYFVHFCKERTFLSRKLTVRDIISVLSGASNNFRQLKISAYMYLSLNLGFTTAFSILSYAYYVEQQDEYLIFPTFISLCTLPFLIVGFVSVHYELRFHWTLFAMYTTCQALLI